MDTIKTIYANEQQQATLICDACGKTRVFEVATFRGLHKPLKVKCSCGNTFWVNIEGRQFYRKHTNLVGEYRRLNRQVSAEVTKGRISVEDLSRTGIGFRTHDPHTIRVQDTVQVRFVLDDIQKSAVTKSAVVRRVNGYFVGAQFLDFDAFNEVNRTLGFYLMPG